MRCRWDQSWPTKSDGRQVCKSSHSVAASGRSAYPWSRILDDARSMFAPGETGSGPPPLFLNAFAYISPRDASGWS